MGGFKATAPEVRVWRHVDKRAPDECWPWLGAVNKGGYGIVNYGSARARSSTTATRLIYLSLHHFIPAGHVVMHECGNPICCNPCHLMTGTPKQNNEDRVAEGRKRAFKGRKSKLSDRQILDMRQARNVDNRPLYEVAETFGISEVYCSAICTGKRKSHVTEATARAQDAMLKTRVIRPKRLRLKSRQGWLTGQQAGGLLDD